MDRRAAGGKSAALEQAVERAVRGDDRALFALLARGSGLPGVRANLTLAEDFGRACAMLGPPSEKLAVRMATLDPDFAPGATELEFLPLCGITAVGLLATADDAARARLIPVLHDAADDLRFRVRDAVPEALGRIGARVGEALVDEVIPWMDGYFHATAVLRALARPDWLPTLREPGKVLALLETAFVLARDAERAAARYPGHKALIEALGTSPGVLAARFGVPVFNLLERWSSVKDPVLREAVAKNLGGSRLAGRFASEIARVRRALESSAPVRRDPTTYVGPTRGRGKKRHR